jgi:hypothetical protein
MLKKTLTYKNLDGETVTKDFYFNMTKAELVKLQLAEDGGWEAKIKKIMDADKPDAKLIIDTFEEILRLSYGTRTKDGEFYKSTEAFHLFLATEAYSDLFFDLVTDAKKSAEFIEALLPADLLADAKKAQDDAGARGQHPHLVSVDEGSRFDRMIDERTPVENLNANQKKVRMSREEILAGMRAKTRVLSYEDVEAMTQEELDAALEAGATLDPKAYPQR